MFRKLWNGFRYQFIPKIIVWIAKALMRIVILTCRIKINGLDQFVKTASKERCILMLWHNRLAIMPEVLTRYASQFIYCAFISKSKDGELLALLTKSYSIGRTLRVSHNGRLQALNQMIDQLKVKKEIMVLTPDGPRGPRYEMKPGVVIAAKEANACIIPLSWSCSSIWQLESWDKLMFPLPFSRLAVTFGDPIYLNQEQNVTLGEDMSLLKQMLMHLDIQVCSSLSKNSADWPK